MKRRNFIKGLCKAIGVAAVVPTMLVNSSINDYHKKMCDYYIGCDPISHSYDFNVIVIKTRKVGKSWVHASMTLMKYCKPYKQNTNGLWERTRSK